MSERGPKPKKISWTEREISSLGEGVGGIIDPLEKKFIREGKLPPWLDKYREIRDEHLAKYPEHRRKIPKKIIDELMKKAQEE